MNIEAYLLLKGSQSIQVEEYVTYINAPLDEEIRLNSALSNYMWEEADQITKEHDGLINVSMPVIDIQTDCIRFVEKVCSLINDYVVGIYMNDVIYEPEFYLTMAKMIEQELFPVYNIIWFGLYPSGDKIGAYTDGLETLGYHEIELSSMGEPMEIIEFLKDTANYVIANDVTFKDGETIGLTIEQVLKISLGSSDVFDTDTFKIEDPFYEN